MSNDYFKNKICIVTGADSGSGYALSDELLKKGPSFIWQDAKRQTAPSIRKEDRLWE
jgi:Dehydrogenases with different specificities (related to short-chain alcohol dehydrogenases)